MTVLTTLARAADEIAERQLRPPVLVVVGEVAALESGARWFTLRPLFDVRVMVTRPLAHADSLHERLCELGAEVLVQPAIEITAPDDWGPLDRALARFAEFDWLVFSSANGVDYLLERLCQRHGDLRPLGPLKLAAIGPGTAEALAGYKLRPDIVPDELRAEALAEALAGGAAGRRFLLARASRGREVLAEQLRAAGGEVEQVVVYRSRDVVAPDPEIAAALAAGRIDWVTVTSSAIARSLAGRCSANSSKGPGWQASAPLPVAHCASLASSRQSRRLNSRWRGLSRRFFARRHAVRPEKTPGHSVRARGAGASRPLYPSPM
ncbi:MAG TPA: uroporphyrinogen-III synthase [Pirellulales bacterium]|nr:uroporphyrinogen-III synthase [Pirellulales bacterium]